MLYLGDHIKQLWLDVQQWRWKRDDGRMSGRGAAQAQATDVHVRTHEHKTKETGKQQKTKETCMWQWVVATWQTVRISDATCVFFSTWIIKTIPIARLLSIVIIVGRL